MSFVLPCWTGRKEGKAVEGDRRVGYSVMVPNLISCPTEKKAKNKVIFCMGTGERNFPGVAAKGREICFHVARKTSQSLSCLISCVELCR